MRRLTFVVAWLSVLVLSAVADLTWRSHPGHRMATVSPGTGRTGFQRMPSQTTGVTFTNVLGMSLSLTNTPVNNGSGVAVGDVDGDGLPEVYLCRLEGPNALYRNRGGWRFEEVAVASGVACADQVSTGAVFADVEGDGDLDLLVNSLGGGTRLFLNQGSFRFTESVDSGLARNTGSTSMALADIDGDGDLDLYVANYRTTTILDQPQTRFSVAMVNGRPTLTKINGVPATSPELSDRFTLGPDGTPRGRRGGPAVSERREGPVPIRAFRRALPRWAGAAGGNAAGLGAGRPVPGSQPGWLARPLCLQRHRFRGPDLDQ